MDERFRRLFALAAGVPVQLVTRSLSLRDERIDPESGVEDLTAELEAVYGARLTPDEVVGLRSACELRDLVQQRRAGR
ncbi:MAG TPA: hypothetical protein VD866_27870 [Urbifossiella sp.]|nr:hypothetical protein [Urbifossiella sp.]